MKTFLTALLSLCALVTLPAFANNQASDTVTVGGDVVSPMGISVVGAVLMPDIVKPTAGTSTVSMECDSAVPNVITYGAGANPFANGTTTAPSISGSSNNATPGESIGACSTVTVTGEPNFFFNVTTGNVVAPTAPGITVTGVCYNDLGSDLSTTGTAAVALGTGTVDIFCGADISVDNTANPATAFDNATYTVYVTYD